MTVEVEEVDLGGTVSPADVERVPSATLVIVVAEQIDAHVQLLFDLTDIGRVDRVLEAVEAVLGKVLKIVVAGGRDGCMSNRMERRGHRVIRSTGCRCCGHSRSPVCLPRTLGVGPTWSHRAD